MKSHEKPINPMKSQKKPINPMKSHEKPINPMKSHEKPINPMKSNEIPWASSFSSLKPPEIPHGFSITWVPPPPASRGPSPAPQRAPPWRGQNSSATPWGCKTCSAGQRWRAPATDQKHHSQKQPKNEDYNMYVYIYNYIIHIIVTNLFIGGFRIVLVRMASCSCSV